eukprot:CFRG5325T1
MTQYESLNYDRCENAIFRKSQREKFVLNKAVIRYDKVRWLATFVIAVCTALIAFGIDSGQDFLTEWKFDLVGESIDKCEREGCLWWSMVQFCFINMGFAFIASVFVAMEPIAAGSGIPEVKCYLNGIKISHVVRLKTLVCKVVGVLFSTSGGLAVGKEGPMIHSGAVLGAGLSQGKSTSIPWINMHMRMFRTDRAKRDFVSCGAAAGVAAAFGAPIGGVLFALEEGSSFWNQALTWRSFFCAMTATFTLNFLLSGVREDWGDMGFPGLVSFGVFASDCKGIPEKECDALVWRASDMPMFLLMGAMGGLLGAIFNSINEHITVFRMRYIHSSMRMKRIVEVLFVAVVTSTLMFCAARYLGQCQPIPHLPDSIDKEATKKMYKTYFCPDGTWNDMATLTTSGNEAVIRTLFHRGEEFSFSTLGSFFAMYFVIVCWTYGIGVPSGIFVPTLLAGSVYGRLCAMALQRLADHFGWEHVFYYGPYALIGAASLLGGVVRMTISLTVIIIETTNNVSFGLPVMMALMLAKWVGDSFNEGLYDIHIALKQIPLLEWEPPKEMMSFYAAQVMTKNPLTIEEIDRVSDIIHVLKTTSHAAYPVVVPRLNPDGVVKHKLVGIILRSQLVILLKHKAYGRMVGEESGEGAVDAPVISYETFIADYPRYPKLEDITVPVEAGHLYIDLTPYMHPCPYTVLHISPLPRVFNLFRTMGLRQLPVTDRDNNLLGIITRKDLTNLEYRHQDMDGDLETRGKMMGMDLQDTEEGIASSDMRSMKDFLIAEGDVGSIRSLGRDDGNGMALHTLGVSRSNDELNHTNEGGPLIFRGQTQPLLESVSPRSNRSGRYGGF